MSEILKVLNRKVELKSEKVEFGFLQSVESNAKKQLDNFKGSRGILSQYEKAEQQLLDGLKLMNEVEKYRKGNLISLPGHIEDIRTDLKTIRSKFSELGLDAKKESDEYVSAMISVGKLEDILKQTEKLKVWTVSSK